MLRLRSPSFDHHFQTASLPPLQVLRMPGENNLALLKGAFDCINDVGLEWAERLCTKRHHSLFSDKDFIDEVGQKGIDGSAWIQWRIQMDDTEVKWISDLIIALKSNIGEILSCLFLHRMEYWAMTVARGKTDGLSNSNDADEIVVRRSGVYLKRANESEAEMLMSIKPLLWYCRNNLNGFTLHNEDLSEADLSDANLIGAQLINTDLTEANLVNAILCGSFVNTVDFVGAFLADSDFTDATLKNCDLLKADLRGANFTRTNFDRVRLTSASINDKTKFDGATITLFPFPCSTEEDLVFGFDHLHNDSGTSLLTTIDSIGSRYNTLKLDLMHQVVKMLENVDISCIAESLMDVFLKNPIYTEDSVIAEFIYHRPELESKLDKIDLW